MFCYREAYICGLSTKASPRSFAMWGREATGILQSPISKSKIVTAKRVILKHGQKILQSLLHIPGSKNTVLNQIANHFLPLHGIQNLPPEATTLLCQPVAPALLLTQPADHAWCEGRAWYWNSLPTQSCTQSLYSLTPEKVSRFWLPGILERKLWWVSVLSMSGVNKWFASCATLGIK